jgi:agmatine/peptidylarginine deiminase
VEVVAEVTRPSLEEYQPGEEVWAYFPQSQDKWLKGVVEWVRGNTIRVVSGFFGAFVESPEAIAPGDWVMTG